MSTPSSSPSVSVPLSSSAGIPSTLSGSIPNSNLLIPGRGSTPSKALSISRILECNVRRCLGLLCKGESLSPNDIMACMSDIIQGQASPALIGGFLLALSMRPLSAELLYYSAKIMSTYAVPFPGDLGEVLDIVGTGGDSADTFNVSTAAALVVAATPNSTIRVAKHGNRSSSGRCGSADLVEALGARLELSPEDLSSIISECNFGFLYAQRYHPAMKSVAAIRKELGVRTIFNVLGPLISPASPTYMLIGVGTKELAAHYAQVCVLAGLKRAMIVHSEEGLDEISPAGLTYTWTIENGVITEGTVTPADFGLEPHSLEDVAGGNPEANAQTLHRVFSGEETGPVLDFVLMNASAALVVAGLAKDFKEGTAIARESIANKLVAQLVSRYVSLTQSGISF